MNTDANREVPRPLPTNPGRQRFGHRLLKRYALRRSLHRRIPWRGYLLSSLNIIAIALFVFDAPLGQAAKNLPPRLIAIAATVTDIGRLVSILAAACIILAIGLFVAWRLSTATHQHTRITYFTRIAIHATIYVGLSVLSASIAVHILKYAIGRTRPLLYEQYGILGFEPFHGGFLFQSFPSAHATHIGALFAAFALLFPRFRLLFASLGLWLGVTRVIIGVHYPSDVAAGLALGAWFAFAIAMIFARFGLIFSIGPSSWPTSHIGSLARGKNCRRSVKKL